MLDEGPSAEDLTRFGDDEFGYCPECGDEVWDDVTACPSCGEWIEGRVQSRKPHELQARRRMIALIAIALAILISGIVAFTQLF